VLLGERSSARVRFQSAVDDIRWFAPNPYTSLIVPELRRAGLSIALEGTAPARLALSMSGTRALEAWGYAHEQGCPLVLYIWDLPPMHLGSGSFDPVWWCGGRFLRLPRPFGGFRRRRGYYSRLRYIATRAEEVWVPSEMSWGAVRRHFDVECRRVPYCYDSERFRPGRDADHGPATLLTVSRLQPHKNHAATIRATARLGRQVQVRLIGRGPEYEALQRLAHGLGVRCRIDTQADDAEVASAYHRARVVVCPSRFEGFGLTPVEGIASGTPVVASDIPPHREFVAAAARLFPLDDDAALVTSIAAALDDPAPNAPALQELTITAAANRFVALLRPMLR
jgi:glycosyltransferase involved in cell wall biosynthesis